MNTHKGKTLTKPHLELQAAAITVRLKIVENFDININFWVDSQIVLKYLQNTSCNFPVLVMNHLNKIRANSNIVNWNLMSDNQNPADNCK